MTPEIVKIMHAEPMPPNPGCSIRGLKRWDEGRWVRGSLVCILLSWGIFPIPHLPLPYLLSPVILAFGLLQAQIELPEMVLTYYVLLV